MTLETTRNKTIAFFDFDGTLTKKDTLLGFIINSFSPYEIIKAVIFLSPVLLKFLFKIENNSISKEKIFCYFFRGLSEEKMLSMGANYALKKLPKIIRPLALDKIRWHKKHGHEVVIVTASTKYWIEPWAKKYSVKLIATELENINNMFTGRYKGLNCHGKEKVQKISREYDLNIFDIIYAYGDSSGDKQMLELADHCFYQPFR